jgi:hypothetical protein
MSGPRPDTTRQSSDSHVDAVKAAIALKSIRALLPQPSNNIGND